MIKIFEVVFYKSSLRNEPVLEWLSKLSKNDEKIIGSDIRMIELSGKLNLLKDNRIKETLGSKKSFDE